MEYLENIHPGEILQEDFLKEYGITGYRLAKETNLPMTRVSEILRKKRKITPDTAIRFAAYFGNSAEFWLGLQTEYDLREERARMEDEVKKIQRISAGKTGRV